MDAIFVLSALSASFTPCFVLLPAHIFSFVTTQPAAIIARPETGGCDRGSTEIGCPSKIRTVRAGDRIGSSCGMPADRPSGGMGQTLGT